MRRVFAIDDDTDILEMMAGMLSPMGCAMESATQCKGSIEKIRLFVPDCILLDVMLPDGSGYEISRSVRADSTLYKTPIMFVSAIADDPEVEYAMSQGCDAYLHKPFSLKDLTARLHEMNMLTTRINQPSTETGLMTLESITREIDHRVFQRRAFSLCYISIVNFDSCQTLGGQKAAAQLITFTGETICQALRLQGLRNAAVAHLGREHFLALLPAVAYKDFCVHIESDFAQAAPRGISLSIDVALHNESHQVTTRNLLHELLTAHKKPEGGQERTLFRWNLHRDW